MITITYKLHAQSTTGAIFGAVVDPTGAAIPGAAVTLTNVHTGEKRTTTTNGNGEYTYAIVNPGDYTVASSATGFKTLTHEVAAGVEDVVAEEVVGGAVEAGRRQRRRRPGPGRPRVRRQLHRRHLHQGRHLPESCCQASGRGQLRHRSPDHL
jgi:hypothetical protein